MTLPLSVRNGVVVEISASTLRKEKGSGKWKAKDDNRPYETPKCPLSLSALQPYEVKVPLEISD
jgi:hypothetical protein